MLVLVDQSEQTIRGVDTFLQLLQRIFIFTDFNVIDPSEQFRLKGSYRPFYGTFPILAPSSVSLSLMSSRIFSLGTPCWIFAASSCLFPFGNHVCWMSLVWPEWVQQISTFTLPSARLDTLSVEVQFLSILQVPVKRKMQSIPSLKRNELKLFLIDCLCKFSTIK